MLHPAGTSTYPSTQAPPPRHALPTPSSASATPPPAPSPSTEAPAAAAAAPPRWSATGSFAAPAFPPPPPAPGSASSAPACTSRPTPMLPGIGPHRRRRRGPASRRRPRHAPAVARLGRLRPLPGVAAWLRSPALRRPRLARLGPTPSSLPSRRSVPVPLAGRSGLRLAPPGPRVGGGGGLGLDPRRTRTAVRAGDRAACAAVFLRVGGWGGSGGRTPGPDGLGAMVTVAATSGALPVPRAVGPGSCDRPQPASDSQYDAAPARCR